MDNEETVLAAEQFDLSVAGFDIDNVDDSMMHFLSTSEDGDSDSHSNEDYETQIEKDEEFTAWTTDRNEKKDSQNKNKRKLPADMKDETETETETQPELNDQENYKNDQKNNKYSEIMKMEQSTAGIDQDHVRESQLFREFRVIGLVCNEIPFCYQKLGDSFFIGTSIGKSFQIYKGKSLRLAISARSTDHKINAIIMQNELTFTAVRNQVQIWYRIKKVGSINKHLGKVYIIKLLGNLLLTLSEDQIMHIWDMKRLINRKFDISAILKKTNSKILKFPNKSINFNQTDRITSIVHPATYLNKILIGYESGKLELWNINTCKLIYSFKNHMKSIPSQTQSEDVGISCLEMSPILDVVGIGFNTGHITIHNIRKDSEVMHFSHSNTNNRITRLSFRGDGTPHLVSLSAHSRNIVIWNLKKRKLENIVYNAHHIGIAHCQFVDNECILITSGLDNSLKMWIFDELCGNTTGRCRLLKTRSGHRQCPNNVKFHGNKCLLSSSSSSNSQSTKHAHSSELRVSWIQRDIQCLPFGMRKCKKMLQPIKNIQSSFSKSRFWSNVVTVHSNDNTIGLWSTAKMAFTNVIGGKDSNNKSNITCSVISHCSNYVFVGRLCGAIDVYNIESQKHRSDINAAHSGVIRSLYLSMLNNVLISIGGMDGKIKFWNVSNLNSSSKLIHECDIEVAINKTCYDCKSNLLAISADNGEIYLFDANKCVLIRKFSILHVSQMTDMILSPQCKWLLISCMNGDVLVYDLMCGLLIDWLTFENAVISMSFAMNNTFLATTHINQMGITIWSNKAHFDTVCLRNVGKEPIQMDMSKEELPINIENYIFDNISDDSDSDSDSDDDMDLSDVLVDSKSDLEDLDGLEFDLENGMKSLHLNNGLITMSESPKSVWKNVANWDLILKRNRASVKVKNKKIENIPFFIPTKKQHDFIQFDVQNSVELKINEISAKNAGNDDRKMSKLVTLIENDDGQLAMAYLLSLSPSQIDSEMHLIGISAAKSIEEFTLVLQFFIDQITKNENFELIESIIYLFLKIHSDLIVKYSDELSALIEKLKGLMQIKWRKINALFQSNLSLISLFSHIQQ